MRRREFIAVLGSAAAFALEPCRLRAQSTLPTVGVLFLGSPPPEQFIKALRASLLELGYSEERNIKLEIRTANGVASRLPQLATELVLLKVDVIVAWQTPTVVAAKQATSKIPIVMVGVGDPIGTGLVASFARPGGNITGTTAGVTETASKTVELIRELLPSARRFALLANEADPFTKSYLAENERIARNAGMEMVSVMAQPARSLAPAFENMTAQRVHAVIVQGSLVSEEAVELAAKHQLPSLSSALLVARLGGLMAYSADFEAYMRETAGFIDRILKGENPANLPVLFPTKFVLVVNLKTAKALGLTVPASLLARADEVIE